MKGLQAGFLAFAGVLTIIAAVPGECQVQNLPPNLRRAASNPDQDAYRQIQIQRTLDAQQRTAMRRAEEEARASARVTERMPTVSPEDLKRIEKLLTPSAEDLQKYKSFLDLDRTGIFKLFQHSACEESRVVRVDGECSNSVPGGSRYSFRSAANTPDIHYFNDRLYVKGFFAHHLLANIGDLPIEDLTPGDRFLGPLGEFVPSLDFDGARAQSSDIENELTLGGTVYSNSAPILVNSTYLLRIVAYKNGNNLQRRLDRAAPGQNDPLRAFEKLLTDHRMDLTLAFRVIRKDETGNLTIIWRELGRKKAPVITFPEDQSLADFN